MTATSYANSPSSSKVGMVVSNGITDELIRLGAGGVKVLTVVVQH